MNERVHTVKNHRNTENPTHHTKTRGCSIVHVGKRTIPFFWIRWFVVWLRSVDSFSILYQRQNVRSFVCSFTYLVVISWYVLSRFGLEQNKSSEMHE
jgi:hypothetical protein